MGEGLGLSSRVPILAYTHISDRSHQVLRPRPHSRNSHGSPFGTVSSSIQLGQPESLYEAHTQLQAVRDDAGRATTTITTTTTTGGTASVSFASAASVSASSSGVVGLMFRPALNPSYDASLSSPFRQLDHTDSSAIRLAHSPGESSGSIPSGILPGSPSLSPDAGAFAATTTPAAVAAAATATPGLTLPGRVVGQPTRKRSYPDSEDTPSTRRISPSMRLRSSTRPDVPRNEQQSAEPMTGLVYRADNTNGDNEDEQEHGNQPQMQYQYQNQNLHHQAEFHQPGVGLGHELGHNTQPGAGFSGGEDVGSSNMYMDAVDPDTSPVAIAAVAATYCAAPGAVEAPPVQIEAGWNTGHMAPFVPSVALGHDQPVSYDAHSIPVNGGNGLGYDPRQGQSQFMQQQQQQQLDGYHHHQAHHTQQLEQHEDQQHHLHHQQPHPSVYIDAFSGTPFVNPAPVSIAAAYNPGFGSQHAPPAHVQLVQDQDQDQDLGLQSQNAFPITISDTMGGVTGGYHAPEVTHMKNGSLPYRGQSHAGHYISPGVVAAHDPMEIEPMTDSPKQETGQPWPTTISHMVGGRSIKGPDHPVQPVEGSPWGPHLNTAVIKSEFPLREITESDGDVQGADVIDLIDGSTIACSPLYTPSSSVRSRSLPSPLTTNEAVVAARLQGPIDTRRWGACIRCHDQKAKCRPDVGNPRGQCLTCASVHLASKKTFHRLFCVRDKINDAVLFREGGLQLTTRWRGTSMVDVTDRVGDRPDIRTIKFTLGVCEEPVVIEVVRFRPNETDVTSRFWYGRGALKCIELAPYCLNSVNYTAKYFENYVFRNALPALLNQGRGNLHNVPRRHRMPLGIIEKTYQAAVEHYHNLLHRKYDKTNEALDRREASLMRDTIIFWFSSRHSTGMSYICGEDTLDMKPETEDHTYPLFGKVSLPRMVIAQFDSINHTKLLQRYNKNVLQELDYLMSQKQPRFWWTIYLCLFILLRESSYISADRYRHARDNYGSKIRYSLPNFVHSLQFSCNVLLQHWHYYKSQALPDASQPWDRHKSELCHLTSEQFHLIVQTINEPNIKQQIAYWTAWRGNNCMPPPPLPNVSESEQLLTFDWDHQFYWVAQLFDDNWTPQPIYDAEQVPEMLKPKPKK